MYMSMRVTTNHDDALAVGQKSAKQGRFICGLCNIHFYHATALVSHYDVMNFICVYIHKYIILCIKMKLYRQSLTSNVKSNTVKRIQCTVYILYLENVLRSQIVYHTVKDKHVCIFVTIF